ncbi:MAG: glutamyl-tRNA reductase, partial [Gammaproteobacteria bacterium]|nr:glutamyl-tRNA reductase [Gammaproteobacteria bacterium]
IDQHVHRFMGWLGTRAVTDTIMELRTRAEITRDEMLAKAQRRLAAGDRPEEVLAFLANTLTNKLMHAPTVQIRRAGARSRHELVAAARSLHELSIEPREESDPTDAPGDDGAES